MTIQNKIFDTSNHEYTISETKINDTQTLKYNKELGIGFLNPPENMNEVYDENYWTRYRAMCDTEIGKNLNQCRIDIVDKFKAAPIHTLDVGIGNGDFVDKFGCYGYDVNPEAIKYLKANRKFINPYTESCKWQCITMFDVIEHIEDIESLLSKTDMVILSTPIYKDLTDVLGSKHFRPTEHLWYFTISGLIHYLNFFGFDCKYYSTIETKIGRDSIGSFVFKRD